jgi:hypothetical protein
MRGRLSTIPTTTQPMSPIERGCLSTGSAATPTMAELTADLDRSLHAQLTSQTEEMSNA